MEKTPLQRARQKYSPALSDIFRELSSLEWAEELVGASISEKMRTLFPLTAGQPLLRGKKGSPRQGEILQVGVVFSGGQAAGGHNVITGLYDALKQMSKGSRLFGFLDGPSGIIKGKALELTEEKLKDYRNQGGFDLIGSGRTKIETEEQLKASLEVVQKMSLDGLVIIGGDDSNTIAAVLAEYFKSKGSSTCVVGVPKTIDGDLKNPYVSISFGFDTACKTYAELIGNIARDATSAKKYTHFIKLMGRSASHIALECALATQPNLTLISEEIAHKRMTLAQITSQIADLICQRAAKGKNYGVVLIPEGLIEFIPEIAQLIKELNQILAKDPEAKVDQVVSQLSTEANRCFSMLPEQIQKQLLMHRDPHGNVQVSLIETERLLIETVSHELEKRRRENSYQGKFAAQPHFLGYEGRAGFPSNFDSTYCYALGHAAALLVDQRRSGYMCFIEGLSQPAVHWKLGGAPLVNLMHFEMRKGVEKPVIQKALVDLDGKPFGHFKQHREQWALNDVYLFPGPIQFFGEAELSDSPPLSLKIE
ncbi:MAG: diphosphate--fructose-6-phosphate 1-phosphotransferase [Chlamydiota bacterium]